MLLILVLKKRIIMNIAQVKMHSPVVFYLIQFLGEFFIIDKN